MRPEVRFLCSQKLNLPIPSQSGRQVILCTHSSALIDVERYQSIYIVTKENEGVGTSVKQCSSELFTGDMKKDFNLSYWINPDRGELFFATKVVLVEGPTDKTVIPLLARMLGVFRYDYTVIDCGSKTNIPLYVRVLNAFSIPYVAVYDKDHQEYKEPEAVESASAASKQIEDEIQAELGSSIVCDNDIEEEIGYAAGRKSKPAAALAYVSAEGFEVPPQLEVKIRSIYDD